MLSALRKIKNQRIRNKRINYPLLKSVFTGKYGIEIGGPSKLFTPDKFLPIYPLFGGLDGVNFSSQTIWEGELTEGNTYHYFKEKTGHQFISDAVDLSSIDSNSYDFLISSNCLEHVANPLKAFSEWVRVVKHGGYILIALPNKKYNFDQQRPDTSFEHILKDYELDQTEHDLTHLEEVITLHDISLDEGVKNKEELESRSRDNYNNRAMHHHVFSMELITQIFSHFNLEVLHSVEDRNFIFLGQKK